MLFHPEKVLLKVFPTLSKSSGQNVNLQDNKLPPFSQDFFKDYVCDEIGENKKVSPFLLGSKITFSKI